MIGSFKNEMKFFHCQFQEMGDIKSLHEKEEEMEKKTDEVI